ncbi:unnamed protein product, partial [Echinostoma caproni]|uniref:Ras family protein n=1 Tax=Echinostoma caproni TaxID=27848 RepID=A0A183AY99_9TREM
VPTIEDTYNAVVETDRGTRERVRIYDIGDPAKVERHFINSADAFILVYDVSNASSFVTIQKLKREIDDCRSKREVLFFLCGNKSDKAKDKALDPVELARWTHTEKDKSGFSFGKKDTRGFPGPTGPSRTEMD